jgi:PIN domain nuclease of toxin-antitoxin system
MKLLLDTNVFIWLNDAPHRVRESVMNVIANPDNDLCLSLTSIWEMQIKIQHRQMVRTKLGFLEKSGF